MVSRRGQVSYGLLVYGIIRYYMKNIIRIVASANAITVIIDNRKCFSIFFVIIVPIKISDTDNNITCIVFIKKVLCIRSFSITKYINMINAEHDIAISCFILNSVYWIFILVKIE